MAPKGMKRRATMGGAGAPPKKQNTNFAGVKHAIDMHEGLPASCKKMLIACIPHGLGGFRDERKDSQNIFVGMVSEVMEGVRVRLQREVDAAAAKFQELEGSKDGLGAKIEAAESAVAAAAIAVHERTARLAEATTVAREAKSELQAKKAAQREGNVEYTEASNKLSVIEEAIVSHIKPLVEAADDAGRSHFSALRPFLDDFPLDESLKNALPTSCSKPLSDRTSFDSMAIDHLQKHFEQTAAALRESVRAGEPTAREHADAVSVAQAAADQASAAQARCAEELATAKHVEQEASAACNAARRAAKNVGPDLERAMRERDNKAEELEQFVSYNMTCFTVLRDAEAPQKPSETADAVIEE